MTAPRSKIYTIKCPFCPREWAHMFPDTARRMRDAHVKKEHKDKETDQ